MEERESEVILAKLTRRGRCVGAWDRQARGRHADRAILLGNLCARNAFMERRHRRGEHVLGDRGSSRVRTSAEGLGCGCGTALLEGAGPGRGAAAVAGSFRRLARDDAATVLGTEKPDCGGAFLRYEKEGGSTVSAAANVGSLLRWEALGCGETMVDGRERWGAGSGRCWMPLVMRSVLSMQKAREHTKLKKVSAMAAAAPAWCCSAALAPGAGAGAGM